MDLGPPKIWPFTYDQSWEGYDFKAMAAQHLYSFIILKAFIET